MMSLSFRQIEVLRAVMIAGSISAAAKQLGVAQPGVSNTIRRIEDILEIKLFERSPSRLIPTEIAHQVFDEVEKAYARFDQLSDAITEIVSRRAPRFRVGVSPSLCLTAAPQALAKLAAVHPDLSLQCDTLSVSEVNEYLWFGTGHCAATIFPIKHPLVASTPVGEGGLVCIVASDHPLAGRPTLHVDDLLGQRVLRFEEGTPHGQAIDQLFGGRTMDAAPEIRIRFAYAAFGMVQAGFGLAIVDSFTAFSGPLNGVRVIPFVESPRLPVFLHWNREQPASMLVDEFAACLRRSLEAFAI